MKKDGEEEPYQKSGQEVNGPIWSLWLITLSNMNMAASIPKKDGFPGSYVWSFY